MDYLIFLIIFLAIANWTQIIFFGLALLRPKVKKTKLKDEWMLEVVKKKAGIILDRYPLKCTKVL